MKFGQVLISKSTHDTISEIDIGQLNSEVMQIIQVISGEDLVSFKIIIDALK